MNALRGAIQRGDGWGKGTDMRNAYSPRRRRSPLPIILALLLILIVGGIIYLASRDTEVPTSRIEQDVTNAALGR